MQTLTASYAEGIKCNGPSNCNDENGANNDGVDVDQRFGRRGILDVWNGSVGFVVSQSFESIVVSRFFGVYSARIKGSVNWFILMVDDVPTNGHSQYLYEVIIQTSSELSQDVQSKYYEGDTQVGTRLYVFQK